MVGKGFRLFALYTIDLCVGVGVARGSKSGGKFIHCICYIGFLRSNDRRVRSIECAVFSDGRAQVPAIRSNLCTLRHVPTNVSFIVSPIVFRLHV